MSDGLFCDSKMLGWTGGAEGIAAQIPESVAIGDAPPATKPRPGETSDQPKPDSDAVVQGLYEKKLSKEEKKKLADEKRRARRAAKETAITEEPRESHK
jgi:hypothetical protein